MSPKILLPAPAVCIAPIPCHGWLYYFFNGLRLGFRTADRSEFLANVAMERAFPAPNASHWRLDIGAAALAAAVMLAATLSAGTEFLNGSNGDNDSLLRMVQVRDLIAGQGWFDLTQYRMGLEGGFTMHWSRLVDAPIAAIVLAGTWISGDQAIGEAAALILWPGLLFMAAVFLILRCARLAYGEAALLPALVTGGTALYSVDVFVPGAIDHHNLQLVLTFAMVWGILARSFGSGVVAGVAAALSLAVGAETTPYVALGGIAVSVLLLLRGREEAALAGGFGTGFAAAALVAFVATVPAHAWLVPACDSYSIAQSALAIVAGLGLAAVARFGGAGFAARTGGLALLGATAGALLLGAFPQCLSDPFADLDPLLRSHWLDHIAEAQSIFSLATTEPVKIVYWYATPLLALGLAAFHALRGDGTRGEAIAAALVAGALAVGAWQVRGSVFSVPLAAIVLSGWIARARAAGSGPAFGQTVHLALAWILSNSLVWGLVAAQAKPSPQPAANAAAAAKCYEAADYSRLARISPATVAAISNLGSSILKYTDHRALAGPYHRNTRGNLANLKIMLSSPREAQKLASSSGVDLVAVCPGNRETALLADAAPDGLLARLAAGQDVPWLEPLPGADAPLRIYRVRD